MGEGNRRHSMTANFENDVGASIPAKFNSILDWEEIYPSISAKDTAKGESGSSGPSAVVQKNRPSRRSKDNYLSASMPPNRINSTFEERLHRKKYAKNPEERNEDRQPTSSANNSTF